MSKPPVSAVGRKPVVSWLLGWITEPGKRRILAGVGAGLTTLATGTWAVYTYVHPVELKELRGSATYRLCIGPKDGRKWCPSETIFVPDEGDNTVPEWTKKMCTKFKQTAHETGKCISCYVVQIVCNLT
jgi:hypothetical protein